MVIVHSYRLDARPVQKNFYVRSSETPHCPHCDRILMVAGSRKRILRESDGQKSILIIRRLKCEHCKRIHHELPDSIVPYKRYSADAIEEILAEKKEEIYEKIPFIAA